MITRIAIDPPCKTQIILRSKNVMSIMTHDTLMMCVLVSQHAMHSRQSRLLKPYIYRYISYIISLAWLKIFIFIALVCSGFANKQFVWMEKIFYSILHSSNEQFLRKIIFLVILKSLSLACKNIMKAMKLIFTFAFKITNAKLVVA